jgi:oligoribonuclease
MICWLDLETTGLDPTRHAILEIATVVTDDELNVIALGPSMTIAHPQGSWAQVDPYVQTMHRSSGLRDACSHSTATVSQAALATQMFLMTLDAPRSGWVLGGNNVGSFDLPFLRRHAPDLAACFRNRGFVDTTTVRELVRRVWPSVYESAPRGTGGHRAQADLLASIAEMRFYAEYLSDVSAA